MTSELELCPKCLKGHLRQTPESSREVDPLDKLVGCEYLFVTFAV